MFQNYLLQLLTVVAMEPPSNFQADLLRNEKVKVLNAVRRFSREAAPEIAMHGQYEGYLGEKGVPFFLRSGKGLDDKRTEIVIQFKRPPHLMFQQEIGPNILAIQVQPD